ncbi:MAG: electron transport complex protein RnfA [Spirochaetales bacterium]|nr:electron transport complex protein RnfA [Spirochaetales bacterium]
MTYIGILITYVFVSNLILAQFLGLCPFIGVSKDLESAVGMGFAVTFVMTIASLVTWMVYHWILIPLNVEYLQTVTFILTIASLVQLVEMIVQKYSPALYKALGIYLPLITTNCGVLGIALININEGYNLMESFVAGISGGLGFMLALILMSSIRVQMRTERVPKALKGIPIAFISGGLMALAFMAFDKALLTNLLG